MVKASLSQGEIYHYVECMETLITLQPLRIVVIRLWYLIVL